MKTIYEVGKKIAARAVNGHTQTVKSAFVVSTLLAITGWFANGWANHVNGAIENIPGVQRELAAHIAQAVEAFGNLKTTDVRTESEIVKAVASLESAIMQQREEAKEWRSLNSARWEKQDATNDAIAETLLAIKDKLPERKP